jgi:hypothetical protein
MKIKINRIEGKRVHKAIIARQISYQYRGSREATIFLSLLHRCLARSVVSNVRGESYSVKWATYARFQTVLNSLVLLSLTIMSRSGLLVLAALRSLSVNWLEPTLQRTTRL